MAETYVEATAKQGRILRVNAPFDEALTALRKAGCRYPISVKDLVRARIEKGKEHSLNMNGSYTKEGFLYFQDAQPILALNSPLLDLNLARQAVLANRDNRYFFTQDSSMYEKFAKLAEQGKNLEPEKRRAVYLPKNSCELTKDNADLFNILRTLLDGEKDVDNYLTFKGLQEIPLYLVKQDAVQSKKGTLLTQLWFRDLGIRSGLGGDFRDLGCVIRVRGVQDSAEGTAKNFKAYNPKDIREIEKELERLEKILLPRQLNRLNTLVGRLK